MVFSSSIFYVVGGHLRLRGEEALRTVFICGTRVCWFTDVMYHILFTFVSRTKVICTKVCTEVGV